MTKSKQGGRKKIRVDPISKPVKPPTDPELAALRVREVLPIIGDLTSPDLAKRSSAAAAIANAIEDTRFRKLLLREQVVRILLEQTITDSVLESKCAGWGILRNLALEEEADFCIHLYRQDILTVIQGTVQTIIQTIQSQEHPVANLSKAEQQFVWSLTGSIIGLLTTLAEAQEEILQAISNIDIFTDFLFGLLNLELIPAELYNEALTCLGTLTEDNHLITKRIIDHDSWLKGLMHLTDLEGFRAVAACGILHNVCSTMEWFDHNAPANAPSDSVLVPALIKSINQASTQHGASNGSITSTPDEVILLALNIIASIATTLQEVVEHKNRNEEEFEGFANDPEDLDNMMVEQDGSDPEDNEGQEDESGEMDEDEMEADMELVAGADLREDEEAVESQPTLNALIRIATPTIIPIATKGNESLRDAALGALNNIGWTVSSIDFETSDPILFKIWTSTARRLWSEIVSPVLSSNQADVALASSVTSLAWAITRSVKGQVKLQGDEQKKFMALYEASRELPAENGHISSSGKNEPVTVDAFQGLGVKCIGVLGRLALDPAPIELNREIGIFLLTVLKRIPDTSAADAVEALNQFFDIYSDKEYPCDQGVFWADDFSKHLESIAPLMKKLAKSIDKRKQTELRERADETVLNLTRFLAYKKREKSR